MIFARTSAGMGGSSCADGMAGTTRATSAAKAGDRADVGGVGGVASVADVADVGGVGGAPIAASAANSQANSGMRGKSVKSRSRGRRLGIISAAALCAAGAVAWGFQYASGLAVTGLSNGFSWGLYVALFVFFEGLAAGAMTVSALAVLGKGGALLRLRPLLPFSTALATGAILAAGLMIVLDLGSPLNMLAVFAHPNFLSPLLWDMLALSLFVLLSLALLLAVRRKQVKVERLRALSLVCLPYSFVLLTVTALLFATQNARAWWHSALLPLDFMAVGLASAAAVLCLAQLAAKRLSLRSDIRAAAGRAAAAPAAIAACALLAHVVFSLLELLLPAWHGSAESARLLALVLQENLLLYCIDVLGSTLAACCLLAYARQKRGGLPAAEAQCDGSGLPTAEAQCGGSDSHVVEALLGGSDSHAEEAQFGGSDSPAEEALPSLRFSSIDTVGRSRRDRRTAMVERRSRRDRPTEGALASHRLMAHGSALPVAAAALALLAAFAHRMMLLYPAFGQSPLALGANGFGEPWAVPMGAGRVLAGGLALASDFSYMPSAVEWLVALLPLGVLVLVLALASGRPCQLDDSCTAHDAAV